MPAYIIVQVSVRDPKRYEDYKPMVQPSLTAYDGRFLVRSGEAQTMEGSWQPERFVILEFDDADRAKAWWNSEEYREAKSLRQATADTEMILVEGVQGR